MCVCVCVCVCVSKCVFIWEIILDAELKRKTEGERERGTEGGQKQSERERKKQKTEGESRTDWERVWFSFSSVSGQQDCCSTSLLLLTHCLESGLTGRELWGRLQREVRMCRAVCLCACVCPDVPLKTHFVTEGRESESKLFLTRWTGTASTYSECVYSVVCPGVSVSPSIVRCDWWITDTTSSFHWVVWAVFVFVCAVVPHYSMSEAYCADTDKGSCVSVCRRNKWLFCVRACVCLWVMWGSSCRRS